MAPLDRQNFVHGPYTLKGGKLTFRCGAGVLAYDARQAKDNGRDFKIYLTPPQGVQDVIGKVLKVALLEGVKPITYEIAMKVKV